MKTCNKCHLELNEIYFHKNSYSCKSCYSLYYKEYRKINKNAINDKNIKYYKNNKIKILKHQKDYTTNNKQKVSLIKSKYYKKNKKAIIAKQNKNEAKRRQNDVSFKLKKNVSSSIRYYLKRQNSSKLKKSSSKYLNFSFIQLKEHLEKLFEPWMTWGNYGIYHSNIWDDNDQSTWTWQIDHIIPQSNLPYINMDDDNFKKCWSIDNLRPLSSKQNFIDGITKVRHT